MEQEIKNERRDELMMEDYGDDVIDVTDTVEVYQQGKVMHCECGHGIGTSFDARLVKCARCSKSLVDMKSTEREPSYGSGQTELGRFT